MKSIINLLLLCSLVLPIASYSASSIEERILLAHDRFNQVLKKTPDKVIEVTAFFTNDITLDNLRIELQKVPLEIKGFRHGAQSYGGGYSLGANETLDEAVENYRRDHALFIEKRMGIEDNLLSTETDEGLRLALIKHRKEAEQMKQDFDERGLRIIGVELHGKARDIQNFKDEHGFVRVIEVVEKGKPQSAILP